MKWIRQGLSRVFKKHSDSSPRTTPRCDHRISRNLISPNALKVLYRLNSAGYSAYLVGGGVREILLDRKPKDFDVATNATPEQLVRLFRNSRMIGRRFRLVHVFFHGEVIEVSTFRAEVQDDEEQDENVYGTIEEDAWRRDFSINALYYNIADFSVVDYVGGMNDLRQRTIRMIGDPAQRFHEDPVRLLRAIRFAAKLDFRLHTDTEAALRALPHLLRHVAPARLFQEVLKLFLEGNAYVTYRKLQQYDYFAALFPHSASAMQIRNNSMDDKLLAAVMRATDERLSKNLPINPAFLFASFMWPKLQQLIDQYRSDHAKFHQQFHHAVSDILRLQEETVVVPRRIIAMARAIWTLQFHLENRRASRVYRVLEHRYFRAAYDFLALRVESGEPLDECYQWWREIQTASAERKEEMRQDFMSRPARQAKNGKSKGD